MVEKDLRQLINKLYPELGSGLHLPMLGRVHSISDPIHSPALGDSVRPYYAVNVEMLDTEGKTDDRFPIYNDVPLPVSGAGMERGSFEFPQPGAIVEVAFAGGLPSKPFIRTILGLGWSFPTAKANDLVHSALPGAESRLSDNGDILINTFANIYKAANEIVESCQHRKIETDTLTEKVNGYSAEEVNGEKIIDALSFIRLLSGGSFNIGALENLNVTAAKNLNHAGNSISLRAANLISVLAKQKADIKVKDGGKLWLGSESLNVLSVLSELIQLVSELAGAAAAHTHPNVAAPTNAGDFTQAQGEADNLKADLDPVISTS